MKPALYAVEVRHARRDPVAHDVRHRTYQWLVDLDELPVLPRGLRWLARFEARDHLGDPARSWRENVEAILAEHGVTGADGTITALTTARSAGYVFNPLTVYWCHDNTGELLAVVAEVHNTYGERHAYLLRPDELGRDEVTKDFRVSPFYPVDGYYRISVPEPGERLTVAITLHRPGGPPFVATVRGTRRPYSIRALLHAALRDPLATWRVRAAITVHGVSLYLKGLPVQRAPQSGTTAQRLASVFQDVSGLELPFRLQAWDGSQVGPEEGPTLVIRRRRALRRLLWQPNELGAARAYVTGDLDVEGDLAEGFRQLWAFARRQPGATAARPHRARALRSALRLGVVGRPPRAPASEAHVTGRRHSPGRDRRVIAHHYDLSNEFYALLLDESMAYSSAYYTSSATTLPEAQRAKLDLIVAKLGLTAGDRLLDVGCGWGSLILHAAEQHGIRTTGVTISTQQYDWIRKQVADRGLSELVDVRRLDYRELDDSYGRFDAVSSIEMGEHVGVEQYARYAGVLFDRLRPGGRLLLQQMSRHRDAAPGGGPFIEAYIAPDMHMRPVSQTVGFLEQAGFEIRDVEAMREHYARTVQAWIERFDANHDQLLALVGPEVIRVWRLYLVGGMCSFDEGRMGVEQIVARRPREL